MCWTTSGFPELYSFIDPLQSSFLPSHGMETVMIILSDDLRRHLDQGKSVLLLLLSGDWYSQLHFVNPPFSQCWNTGSNLQWLTSYLHGQGEKVVLGEKILWHYPLIYGIPEGQSAPQCSSTFICTPLPSWCKDLNWVVIGSLMTSSCIWMASHTLPQYLNQSFENRGSLVVAEAIEVEPSKMKVL